ncbi:MAG: hypothetical protein ACFFAZ_09925 [Promethearchaeota archaeon]
MSDKKERIAWLLIPLVIIWGYLQIMMLPETSLLINPPPRFIIQRNTFWLVVFLLGCIWYLRTKNKYQQNQEKELLQ